MNILGKLKSAAVEQGVKVLLAPYLDGIGSIRSLDIDTQSKSVRIELALNGEQTFVTVKAGYALHDEADGTLSASVESFEASRPWLNGVFERYGQGRRFRVPEEHTGKVRLALG